MKGDGRVGLVISSGSEVCSSEGKGGKGAGIEEAEVDVSAIVVDIVLNVDEFGFGVVVGVIRVVIISRDS
jgi:hypothetical protein